MKLQKSVFPSREIILYISEGLNWTEAMGWKFTNIWVLNLVVMSELVFEKGKFLTKICKLDIRALKERIEPWGVRFAITKCHGRPRLRSY